jgi:hypothetical protein
MGLLNYVRARKAVKASRAGEWSPAEWIPPKRTVEFVSKSEHDNYNWDTPTDTKGSPSNQELMDRKKPFRPVGPESVDSSNNTTPQRKAEYDPHKYRLMTGDD